MGNIGYEKMIQSRYYEDGSDRTRADGDADVDGLGG